MNESKLRAWWSHRQGLDGGLRGKTPGDVLNRSGWARSVGGVGPVPYFIFLRFEAPATPQYSLVSSLDAISLLRRDIKSLIDKKDLKREVFVEKDSKPLGGLADFPSHAILDRGRLAGLWEYDAERESIAWSSFGIKDKALDAAVAETGKYVREQLGDARSFSLDSPKSRAPRVEALRKAAAKS